MDTRLEGELQQGPNFIAVSRRLLSPEIGGSKCTYFPNILSLLLKHFLEILDCVFFHL